MCALVNTPSFLLVSLSLRGNTLETKQSVTINLALEQNQLCIAVLDKGCGIKEQEKTQIFSAFYQGKHSKNVTLQGSGLGLTIVKESVEQLRGTLTVEHNEPHGCRFSIKIPITKNLGVN